ncbi:MAG: hypothetical protein Q9223_001764 [Gallowayella weberi]
MQPSKILLALAAALPFSVALPAAEADVSNANTNAVSAAKPYWTAVFYSGTVCLETFTEPASFNTYNKPQPCTNILLLNNAQPKRFKFDSQGAWKLQLFKKMDCKGEMTEQGPETQPVCQNVAGIWPKRSFKIVKA